LIFTAYNAKKTGSGAFYGPKADTKKASKRRRREDDKHAVLKYGASQA
jgi:hypothetical protein